MKPYSILDLYPDCILPGCPDKDKGTHQHIYPKQQAIQDCTTKYLFMQGGVGGGKTTAACVKAVDLSIRIPKNRGVVSRFNLDDLYDTTWRELMSVLERAVEKEIISPPTYSRKVQGQYTQIDLPNGSEIKAVHSKNFKRALGANHGWFLVDDAMECPEEFFIGDDTSAGLLSRLRLPHVHFDPATYSEATREHGSLHGMVFSNPPPINTWLHKLFGAVPGIHKLGNDTVTWIQGETNDNPVTGASYAASLIAIQRKLGKSDNNIQRIIYGKSIPAYGGTPVYPQFNHAVHVAPLKYNPKSPIIRSIDFGYHHPAAVFSHIFTCASSNRHHFTLSEVADCFASNVYTFWDKYVIPHSNAKYKSATFLNCGDRAGFRQSSSNKDRRGDGLILQREYHLHFKYRYLDLNNSLQYMRGLLAPKKLCPCGLPYILISPDCPVLIGALEGGYKYSKSKSLVGDKPIEDKFFADIACAWRYSAENYLRYGLPTLTQEVEPRPYTNQVNHTKPTYAWLQEVDEDLAKLLLH